MSTHAQGAGIHLFQCLVQGEPAPTIRWVKDGEDIEEGPRFWFDYSQNGLVSMVIRDVTLADSGVYKCIAENSEGVAVSSSHLVVKAHTDWPGQPQISAHVMDMEEAYSFLEQSLGEPDVNCCSTKDSPVHCIRENFSAFDVVNPGKRGCTHCSTPGVADNETFSAVSVNPGIPENAGDSAAVITDSGTFSAFSINSVTSEEAGDPTDGIADSGTFSAFSIDSEQTEEAGDPTDGVADSGTFSAFSIDSITAEEAGDPTDGIEDSGTFSAFSAKAGTTEEAEVLVARAGSGKLLDNRPCLASHPTPFSPFNVSSSASYFPGSTYSFVDESYETRPFDPSSAAPPFPSSELQRPDLTEPTDHVSQLHDDSGFFDNSATFNISNLEESNHQPSEKPSSLTRSHLNESAELNHPRERINEEPNDNFLSLHLFTSSSQLELEHPDLQSPFSRAQPTSPYDDINIRNSFSEHSRYPLARNRNDTVDDKDDTQPLQGDVTDKDEDHVSHNEQHGEGTNKDKEAKSQNDQPSENGLEQSTTWVEYLDSETSTPTSPRFAHDHSEGLPVNSDVCSFLHTENSGPGENSPPQSQVITNAKPFSTEYNQPSLSQTQDASHMGNDARVKYPVTENLWNTHDQTSFDRNVGLPIAQEPASNWVLDSEPRASEHETAGMGNSNSVNNTPDPAAGVGDINSSDNVRDLLADVCNLNSLNNSSDSCAPVIASTADTQHSPVLPDVVTSTGISSEELDTPRDKERSTVTQMMRGQITETLRLLMTTDNRHVTSTPEQYTFEKPGDISQQEESTQINRPVSFPTQVHRLDLRESERSPTTLLLEQLDLSSTGILESRQEGETAVYRISDRSDTDDGVLESSVDMSDVVRTVLDDGTVQLSFRATLQIPAFVQPPDDVTVSATETIVLTCVVKGHPDPQVTWAKDKSRSEVVVSSRVVLTRQGDIHRLEIRSAGPSDSGQYVCTASNSQGHVTATVTVTVEGTSSSSVDGEALKDNNLGDEDTRRNTPVLPEKSEANSEPGEDEGAVGGVSVTPDVTRQASRTPQDSRTLRYAKLVGLAAAFSLAVLGANKALGMIRK